MMIIHENHNIPSIINDSSSSVKRQQNGNLHLQAETGRASWKVMDAGLVGGDIYIHSQQTWEPKGFPLARSALEHDRGSKVTPLISRQVGLTRLSALCPSAIVGRSHCHQQKVWPLVHTNALLSCSVCFQIPPLRFCPSLLSLSPVSCDLVCLSPPYFLSVFWSLVQPVQSLWALCA